MNVRTMTSCTFAAGSAAALALAGRCAGGGTTVRRRRPAAAVMVVCRPVRQIRPGAAAARLQDLQGSLLGLPLACSMLSFRNLADAGRPRLSEAQAAAVAAEYKIKDLDDQGEPIERAGRPADHFPSPFANELAAKAANGGSRRPTCRRSPRRAATSAASPGSCSTCSRNIRSRARTTSPRS